MAGWSHTPPPALHVRRQAHSDAYCSEKPYFLLAFRSCSDETESREKVSQIFTFQIFQLFDGSVCFHNALACDRRTDGVEALVSRRDPEVGSARGIVESFYVVCARQACCKPSLHFIESVVEIVKSMVDGFEQCILRLESTVGGVGHHTRYVVHSLAHEELACSEQLVNTREGARGQL